MAKKKLHIDYANQSPYTDGDHIPKVAVLHTWQRNGPPSENGTNKALVWLDNVLRSEKLSVHFATDKKGRIGQYLRPTQIGRHVFEENTGKVGIEQEGYAEYTKRNWLGRGKQLHSTARILAVLNRDYGIPLVHSTTHGVCQHKDLPKQTHTDCGPGYPEGLVRGLARQYRKFYYR